MTRIAIDARKLDDGGIGRYVREILARAPRERPDAEFTAVAAAYESNDQLRNTIGDQAIPVDRRQGIVEQDPFVSLDTDGVGELVKIAAERGREARKGLKLGICGEHGGDPASIAFCEEQGLDYVSCSPFRVPVARLEAARAPLGPKTVTNNA